MREKITDIKRHLLPILISLQAILAILTALDALKVQYYQTIRRITFKMTFTTGYDLTSITASLTIMSALYLLWKRQHLTVLTVAAISIPIYVLRSFRASVIITATTLSTLAALRLRKVKESVFWTLLMATLLEASSLAHWLIFKPIDEATFLQRIANLEHELSSLVALMSLAMVLLTLYMWMLRPMARQYIQSMRYIINSIRGERKGEAESNPLRMSPRNVLIISLIIAVFTAIYPYLPSINPSGVMVGVDAEYYVEDAGKLGEDIRYALTGYGKGSRPLMLLIIYGLSKATGLSVEIVVKYLPILIHPLLALGVYVMVNENTGDKEWAAMSSLLTTTGVITVSNMYAYILANTLAIAILYFSIGHLIKAIRTWNMKSLGISIATAVMTMLIHPWTFAQYYTATLLTAIIIPVEAILTKKGSKKMIIIAQTMLLTYLILTGVLVLIKLQVIGGTESIEFMNLINSLTKGTPALAHLVNFWYESFTALFIYYGGALSNITLLGLALIGSYHLSHREELDKFIISLTIVSSLVYPVVYDHSKVRIILNIPLGALAAKGLLEVLRDGKIERRTKIAALTFTVTATLTYTLRSLANLV